MPAEALHFWVYSYWGVLFYELKLGYSQKQRLWDLKLNPRSENKNMKGWELCDSRGSILSLCGPEEASIPEFDRENLE